MQLVDENVMGWVLEGKTDVLEAGDPGFQRGDVRLVRDDPANALRYIAGDITVPVSGAFQALVPLGGISVSRNFSLQPYRITASDGNASGSPAGLRLASSSRWRLSVSSMSRSASPLGNLRPT